MSEIFQTRGPLDPQDTRAYVVRRGVDDAVRDTLRKGEIVALIGPRQTGKTTLMNRLRAEYDRDQAYEPILIDVSPVEVHEEAAWYDYMFRSILRQARSRDSLQVTDLTRDHLGFRELISRLTVASSCGTRLVLMLDESRPIPNEVRHSFLTTVREIYSTRFVERSLEKVTFLLAGTFLPEDLIQRTAVSPFNIAKVIYTVDSDREGVKQLISLLEELGPTISEDAIDRVYWWTHGHLNLTQRVGEIIEERRPLPKRITSQVVDEAVDELLRSGDINLVHVLGVLNEKPEMKDWVQKILQGELELEFRLTSGPVARLDLLGVIRKDEDGRCVIRNRIYEQALQIQFSSELPKPPEHRRPSEPPKPLKRRDPPVQPRQASSSLPAGGQYDDFDLILLADNRIQVRTEHEGEVASDIFKIEPIHNNMLRLGLRAIEQGEEDEGTLKDIGNLLFNLLFTRSVVQAYEASLARARQAKRRGLRIRLCIEDMRIASWPWELLYNPDADFFLASSSETALSRYLQTRAPQRPITASRPLRMLVVVSSPRNLPALNAEDERRLITEALHPLELKKELIVDFTDDATLRGLSRRLDSAPYCILHFIGHGDFQEGVGIIALVDDKTGSGRIVNDQQFASLFLGDSAVGLVVLNSCKGATPATHRGFGGIAPALVQRGVPAVVAMQYAIPDDTATLFSQEFYHHLATGWPVDAAVQKTRNAIYREKQGSRDFAAPVLFMRAKDGMIFG